MALVALETQHHMEPESVERLTAMAQQSGPEANRARHAVRTLGRVMENAFQRTGCPERATRYEQEVREPCPC